MKSNIEIIDTTFGKIKIYNKKSKEEPLEESKLNEKYFDNDAETKVFDDENFFGLEMDNFFDQKILDEYKINKAISKSEKTSDENLKVAAGKIDKNDLNFIDEIYFGNFSKNDRLRKTKQKIILSI